MQDRREKYTVTAHLLGTPSQCILLHPTWVSNRTKFRSHLGWYVSKGSVFDPMQVANEANMGSGTPLGNYGQGGTHIPNWALLSLPRQHHILLRNFTKYVIKRSLLDIISPPQYQYDSLLLYPGFGDDASLPAHLHHQLDFLRHHRDPIWQHW